MGGNPVFRVLPGIRLELAFPRWGEWNQNWVTNFLNRTLASLHLSFA
jgi:hypothetical protein